MLTERARKDLFHASSQCSMCYSADVILNHWFLTFFFEGPKPATRGGEWEPIKISSKFEPSADIPKNTQALKRSDQSLE